MLESNNFVIKQIVAQFLCIECHISADTWNPGATTVRKIIAIIEIERNSEYLNQKGVDNGW